MSLTSKDQDAVNHSLQPIREELHIGEIAAGKIYFTGFKELPDTIVDPNKGVVEIGSFKAVGQLVYWLPRLEGERQRGVYVCLPAKTHGIIKEGDVCDIGLEFIDLLNPPSLGEIRTMLTDGIKLLRETLAAHGLDHQSEPVP